MRAMRCIVLLFAVVPIVWSRLEPCPNDQGPAPKSVVIAGCDNSDDCDFVRGKPVLGDFEFTTRKSLLFFLQKDI